MSINLKVILFSSLLLLKVSLAMSGPDVKNLEIEIQKKSDTQLVLTPPKDHHFNLEAPTAIKVGSSKTTLEKTPEKINASFSKNEDLSKANCEIVGEIFICDNKNTYCVPLKKKWTCKNLSIQKTTENANESPTTPTPHQAHGLFLVNKEDEAFSLAKEDHKLVLIDFFGIWCPPCNLLDQEVFNHKDFPKFNKNYVFLKMDADDPISFPLKSKYNIKGYPTVLITNSSGEEITRIVGSLKPSKFFNEMTLALKLKDKSLTDRLELAEKKGDAPTAFELAKMYFSQEDYAASLKFSLLAQRHKLPTSEQREIFLNSLGFFLKELSKDEGSQKQVANLLKSTLREDDLRIENLDRIEILEKIAEDLKDKELKSNLEDLKLKNSLYLLEHPSVLKETGYTIADLNVIIANLYEEKGDMEKSKSFYLTAAETYTQDIKKSGLSLETERGNNIERIYCLYKGGKVEEAMAAYEKLEQSYPEEFTFYYNHASVLKELGNRNQALIKAESALKFSYGDNRLRAAHIVAELRSQLGKKTEALQLIEDTLQTYPKTKDFKVRSTRYIEKLTKLKDQIKKM